MNSGTVRCIPGSKSVKLLTSAVTGPVAGASRQACRVSGSVTERLYFFIAEYDADGRTGQGGGVAAEGEDIDVLELPLEKALSMITRGEIMDGKTIMLLQHVALRQK